MSRHPYETQPRYAFWRHAMSEPPPEEVDPVVAVPFTISPSDRVATAGSCFAQNIARYLARAGFNYFVTEPVHPMIPQLIGAHNGYGIFSARYGNVYTTRQLLQLMQRAEGGFVPADSIWQRPDGRLVDPFRPRIQPDGFLTETELLVDRAQHLARVQTMLRELDILVFTLGLTECWVSRADGAAFPLCPGVAGGTFDPERYAFVNFGVEEVVADMLAAIDHLRRVNRASRIILTVSPVPLIATAEDRHVLVATTYSKAVLRVAAEKVARERDAVAYFPAYEIITGNHARGRYFAPDGRDVTEEGVAHVMRVFLKHFAQQEAGAEPESTAPPQRDLHSIENARQIAAWCDEVALAAHLDGADHRDFDGNKSKAMAANGGEVDQPGGPG